MLDTLHWAARTGPEQNIGAARNPIEEPRPTGDPTLMTALEAPLNVLPPGISTAGRQKPDAHLEGAPSGFEAQTVCAKLGFSETAPAPKIPDQIPMGLGETGEPNDDE